MAKIRVKAKTGNLGKREFKAKTGNLGKREFNHNNMSVLNEQIALAKPLR